MSKLTEIKRLFQIVKEEDPNAKMAFVKIEIVEYLFSLLEEKEKALAFYADERTYEEIADGVILINSDIGNKARKALNTSSNNEGD